MGARETADWDQSAKSQTPGWTREKTFEETRKVNFLDLKKAGKLQFEKHHRVPSEK